MQVWLRRRATTLTSFRGAPLGADPESITAERGYGSRRSRPNRARARMTGSFLQHRQAPRLWSARKGLVQRLDLLVVQDEFASGGIIGDVFRRGGFWNGQ